MNPAEPMSHVDLIQRLLLAIFEHQQINRSGKVPGDEILGAGPTSPEYPRLQIGTFSSHGPKLFFQWQVSSVMQVFFTFQRDDSHGGVAGRAQIKMNQVETAENLFIDDDGDLHAPDYLQAHLSAALAEASERLPIIEQELANRKLQLSEVEAQEKERSKIKRQMQETLPDYMAQVVAGAEDYKPLTECPPLPLDPKPQRGLLARLRLKRSRPDSQLVALWRRIAPEHGGYEIQIGNAVVHMHGQALETGVELHAHFTPSTLIRVSIDTAMDSLRPTFGSVMISAYREVGPQDSQLLAGEQITTSKNYRLGFGDCGEISIEPQHQPMRHSGLRFDPFTKAPQPIIDFVCGLEAYLIRHERELDLNPRSFPPPSTLMLDEQTTETQDQSIERLKRQLAQLGRDLPKRASVDGDSPDVRPDMT